MANCLAVSLLLWNNDERGNRLQRGRFSLFSKCLSATGGISFIWDKTKSSSVACVCGELTAFLSVLGNAGYHEGHLRHDGKMHVPHPQRGDAPSARGSLLSGECSDKCDEEYLEQRLYLFVSPTEDGQEQRRRGDHRRVHRLLPKRKPDDPDSPVRRLARHPLTSLFSLSVRRMKTSCDRCTSSKTFFNFAEDLEEGSSSFVQLGLFTLYSVLCRLEPVDKIWFVAVGHA